MRILITGGTGFLGRHLIRHLLSENHQVVALVRSSSYTDILPTDNSLLSLVRTEGLDYNELFQNGSRFQAVIHCATNYGRNDTPLSVVLQDNVLWPLQLIEHAITCRCGLFINTDTFFTREKGYDYLKNYTFSKHMLLEALKAKSDVITVVNCRLEHVYGPEDSFKKFTMFVLGELLRNAHSIELSEGLQKRDFVYVKDVVSAYSAILRHAATMSGFQEYEVGTGNCYTIREFVEGLKKMIDGNQTKLLWGALPTRKGEIKESCANISRLRALEWTPEFNLKKGTSYLLEYYKIHGI